MTERDMLMPDELDTLHNLLTHRLSDLNSPSRPDRGTPNHAAAVERLTAIEHKLAWLIQGSTPLKPMTQEAYCAWAMRQC